MSVQWQSISDVMFRQKYEMVDGAAACGVDLLCRDFSIYLYVSLISLEQLYVLNYL